MIISSDHQLAHYPEWTHVDQGYRIDHYHEGWWCVRGDYVLFFASKWQNISVRKFITEGEEFDKWIQVDDILDWMTQDEIDRFRMEELL